MNWIKLTKENIPDEEVIAYGYQGEILIGYIEEDEDGFWCESDNEILENVTHFCLKTKPND